MKLLIALCISSLSVTAYAVTNLGYHGATYPIREQNFVDVAKEQVATYHYDPEDIVRTSYRVNNILPDTVDERIVYDTYTYTAPENVSVDGKIVFKAGEQINPLQRQLIRGKYLFLKDSQITMYEDFADDTSVVIMLVSGDISTMIDDFPDTQIQVANKQITDFLRVEKVPTLLYQDGDKMVRHEIPYRITTH